MTNQSLRTHILQMLKNTGLKYIETKALIKLCSSGNLYSKEQVSEAVFSMLENGELIESAKTKLCLPEKIGLVKGRIRANRRGFAFLDFEDQKSEDLFIAPGNLNSAMDDDIVLAKKIKNKQKGGEEAEVVKVVFHANRTIVGIFKTQKNFGFVLPDNERLTNDVFVMRENAGKAKDGDKVVVELYDFGKQGKKPAGKIIEVLGKPDDKGVDITSVLREYKLYEEFPQTVQDAAAKVSQTVDETKYAHRRKFFGCRAITIDGEDARDFDDAVHVEKEGNNLRLFVHIADVGEYVHYQSLLDLEAYKRGTSVYFPDRVLPMLPKELSNGICSLNEGVTRLTLTCEMLFSEKGDLLQNSIYESMIKSQARMTYNQVTQILNGDKKLCEQYAWIKDDLVMMNALAKKLESKRTQRGAIDFDIPEAYIKVDEQGRTTGIERRPREDSHKLIESFMIAANEVVAEKYFKQKTPFVYRVHEKPEIIRLNSFEEFARGFGEKIKLPKEDIKPIDIQNFLKTIDGKPYERALNKVALRTMQKARYSEMCMGHFGLASVFYCHFTSPIRRYPDLTIHRIIKWDLKGELKDKLKIEMEAFAEESSLESSRREKLAEEAEREVDDMKKAEYMERFIGYEFDGVVSSVTEFGIFVELENTIEGLLRIENLPEDTYRHVEEKFILLGKQHTFRLGMDVRVKVISANKQTKRIDFGFVRMI